MKRIYIKDLKEYTGKEVTIAGWVDVRRDQGKMIFLDIRDMSGIVQCVILPKSLSSRKKTKWNGRASADALRAVSNPVISL